MVNFIPRKLVNGAILRTTTGEQVAIHVNVENGERYARTITGKTIDDLEVRLELDEPLNVEVNGWIQAIGIAKASNAIQAHEVSIQNIIYGRKVITCAVISTPASDDFIQLHLHDFSFVIDHFVSTRK